MKLAQIRTLYTSRAPVEGPTRVFTKDDRLRSAGTDPQAGGFRKGRPVPDPKGQAMLQMLRSGFLVLLILPAGAVAQQSSGTITGAYNADDAVWTVAEAGEDGFPASGWVDREDGLQVTLVGSPAPDGLFEEGTLVMRFTMTGAPEDLRVVEPSVTMVTAGSGEDLVAGSENIDLSVTALERNDEDMAIAGDLVATLTPGGTGELTIDSEDAVLIDGNFQATLTRLDGNE